MTYAIRSRVNVSLPARTTNGMRASFGRGVTSVEGTVIDIYTNRSSFEFDLTVGDYRIETDNGAVQWVGSEYLTPVAIPVSLIHPTRIRLCVQEVGGYTRNSDGRMEWSYVPCTNAVLTGSTRDYCDSHGEACAYRGCDYFGPDCSEVQTRSRGYGGGRNYAYWCEVHTDNNATPCSHCDSLMSNDSIYGSCNSCGSICYSCADDTYYCSECDTRDCDSGSHDECGDYGYCDDDDSYDNSGSGIRNYSYKPSPEFNGEGTAFLGLEIEINSPARNADEVNSSLIYCKEDGSVSRGFEMVTHPMTYEWALANFPFDKMEWLAQNGADPGIHGLHIHISRAAFTNTDHVQRWMRVFYGNEDESVAIMRRRSDQWASFSDRADIGRTKTGTRGNRYQVINNTNYETFEIRGFASTLNPVELRAAMGFVQAAMEFTRDMVGDGSGSADVNGVRNESLSWIEFAMFVESRPEFADLWSEMNSRTRIEGQLAMRFDAA